MVISLYDQIFFTHLALGGVGWLLLRYFTPLGDPFYEPSNTDIIMSWTALLALFHIPIYVIVKVWGV